MLPFPLNIHRRQQVINLLHLSQHSIRQLHDTIHFTKNMYYGDGKYTYQKLCIKIAVIICIQYNKQGLEDKFKKLNFQQQNTVSLV